MTNETVIDFGHWTVPSSWNELTLKQYIEIEKYYADKENKFDARQVLHILTSHSVDEVGQLPIEFVERLLGRLQWLSEAPEWGEPSASIVIDGEKYTINVMEKLKTGEFISVDTVLKSDPHNYAAILAILCRKNGEIYDSKFEAEEYEKRVEMFEKQPITKIMPLVNFFFLLFAIREIPSKLFSKVEEGINLIQQNIETSENLGVFKRSYLNWRMRKLRKLLKSNKNT